MVTETFSKSPNDEHSALVNRFNIPGDTATFSELWPLASAGGGEPHFQYRVRSVIFKKNLQFQHSPPLPPNKAITLGKMIQQQFLLVTSSHKHKCTPCLQSRVRIIFICQRIKFVPNSRTKSLVFLLPVIKQVYNHSLKATCYFTSSEQYLEIPFLPHRKHNPYFRSFRWHVLDHFHIQVLGMMWWTNMFCLPNL